MVEKLYVTPDQLLLYSYTLAKYVIDSGFRPDFIVGIWRGGAPIGIAVQEYFKFCGIYCDHISIRTSSYTGTLQNETVQVHGLEYITENAPVNSKILFIDDIFDSGRSMKAIITMLKNKKFQIKIATVFNKPQNNKTDLVVDYFIQNTDKWIVFPHELEDLSNDELLQFKGSTITQMLLESKQKCENVLINKQI